MESPSKEKVKCTEEDAHRFVKECLVSVGTPQARSSLMAEVLIEADKRGHFSHGIQRTQTYIRDIVKKLCDPLAEPTIVKQTVSTALIDGNKGPGPVVSRFCIDLAIEKAKQTGIGWISCRGSNHYGIAGMWSMEAAKQGMIGMSFTNSSPHMVPIRSVKPVLGTNPISVAAPTKDGMDFVLDMATTVVACGKLEMKVKEEKPLPENWAIDKNGQPTIDAKTGLAGHLLPLGGNEAQSGYKGFALGILVEMFCGIMSGGAYGPEVRNWAKGESTSDISHCFVVIDPACFAPGFEDRMGDILNYCRNLEPVDPDKPVLIAGDPERIHMQKVKIDGGITYHKNVIQDLWKLAKHLGVKPLQGI